MRGNQWYMELQPAAAYEADDRKPDAPQHHLFQ